MAARIEGSGIVSRRRVAAALLYAAIATFLGLATWWVLDDRAAEAGAAASAAGALLLVAAAGARRVGSEPERAVGAIADRAFDALVLSGVAWVARVEDPVVSAGALVALTASSLAAYIRAKSASLGYEVEESLVTRGLRYGLVGVGLLTGGLAWATWATAGVAALSSLVRTSQVLKEERR
jgi:hypothetical protein